jgi:type II secretory pathway component GspD/PulD (secretin)
VIAQGGGLLGSSPIYAPNLDIRSADTVVVTPDAEPVVIGGLIGDDKSSSETKVPFLGDIPLLGNLFKATTKTHNKTDLLIFLTPHIVQSPDELAPVPPMEKQLFSSPTNYAPEQQLEEYLEQLPIKKQ